MEGKGERAQPRGGLVSTSWGFFALSRAALEWSLVSDLISLWPNSLIFLFP